MINVFIFSCAQLFSEHKVLEITTAPLKTDTTFSRWDDNLLRVNQFILQMSQRNKSIMLLV